MDQCRDGDIGGLEWLRAPCRHDWYLGPMTDMLLRTRAAVCVKCWAYNPQFSSAFWLYEGKTLFPVWGPEQYEQYKDEVEKRFFGG